MQVLPETKPIYYRWENILKQRYYQIHLGQDMLQHWVLTKVWGGIGKSSGRIVHVAYPSYSEAILALKDILIIREKRGYLLVIG